MVFVKKPNDPIYQDTRAFNLYTPSNCTTPTNLPLRVTQLFLFDPAPFAQFRDPGVCLAPQGASRASR